MTLEHLQSNSMRLQAESIAHRTIINQFADAINDAATALAHAEKTFGDDQEKIAPFRATVRSLKQERAAIKSPSHYDPLPDAERWLERHPNAEAVPPVAPDVKKGETPLAAFNRRQETTNRVLSQIRRVETAPADPEELVGPLLEQVETLAKEGAPKIVQGRLALPKTINGAITIDHAIAFCAWACRSQVTAAVKALAAETNAGPTMTTAERNDALARGYVELADALRQESACATAAEQAGQRVVRRRSVHPALLLNRKVSPADVYRYLAKGA